MIDYLQMLCDCPAHSVCHLVNIVTNASPIKSSARSGHRGQIDIENRDSINGCGYRGSHFCEGETGCHRARFSWCRDIGAVRDPRCLTWRGHCE